MGTASPQCQINRDKLIHPLLYNHFELIVDLDDDLKRTFYEIECIRGNWSVRELKRQIGSLYYEWSGLSKDNKKLAALTQEGTETDEPQLAIRDPYVFEFLGLKPREVMSEDRTLVEYALTGMNNGLFVSKYQLELPKKEEMQRFIEEQVRKTES